MIDGQSGAPTTDFGIDRCPYDRPLPISPTVIGFVDGGAGYGGSVVGLEFLRMPGGSFLAFFRHVDVDVDVCVWLRLHF